MIPKTILSGVVVFLAFLCLKQDYTDKDLAKEFVRDSRVSFQWATEKKLDVPESVYYDEKREVIYVSSISGSPAAKNQQGFISKLSPTGEILSLKWIQGLHAPKGMWVHNDDIYVSDIDALVKIQIEKGKIMETFRAAGAKFLNDVAVNRNGHVFVTDSRGNSIYKLQDGRLDMWVESEKLQNPNGLYALEEALLVGIRGKVLSIDYQTRSMKDYILNTGGIDGLVPTNMDEEYIISDWQGKVQLIHPDREAQVLVHYTPDNLKAADIEFSRKHQLLLIPTFYDNRVVAYTVQGR